MAAITIRELPDEVYAALKARAKRNGNSTEVEARNILAEAVLPSTPNGVGDYLYQVSAPLRADIDIFVRTDDTYAPLGLR